METYSGKPLDLTFSNGPWDKENGKTVPKSTSSNQNGTMTTTNWPRNATDRTELHHDQQEVIRTAAEHPHIDNIAEINRLCNYRENRTKTYANQVLAAHWPERTSDNFNPDAMETSPGQPTNSSEGGKLQMETTLNGTDEESVTIEKDSTENSEPMEWPNEATPRNELEDHQIEIIETAMEHPDVTSTGELTDLADLSKDRNDYYAHDVLSVHWKERLETDTENEDEYDVIETRTGAETDSQHVTPPEDFDAFPSELGSKDDYNDRQIQLIQTVMLNPEVETASDITRISGLADKHDITYGSTFFYEHWQDWKEYDPQDDGINPNEYRADNEINEESDTTDKLNHADDDSGSMTEQKEPDESSTDDSVSAGQSTTKHRVVGMQQDETAEQFDESVNDTSQYWVILAGLGVGYFLYQLLTRGENE